VLKVEYLRRGRTAWDLKVVYRVLANAPAAPSERSFGAIPRASTPNPAACTPFTVSQVPANKRSGSNKATQSIQNSKMRLGPAHARPEPWFVPPRSPKGTAASMP
jgi:hypothetical protein